MISKYISRKANQWQNLRNRRRVLIIEDLRVGYIPIYKVASTSLRNLFCRRQAKHILPDRAGRKLSVAEKRQVENCIRKSVSVRQTRRLRRRYFLFAFVRNPVTRLYSCYLDKVVRAGRHGKQNAMQRYGVSHDMDFESFARHIARIPDQDSDRHFRSQHFKIYHQGQCLVDFVGNFENMGAHWQILSEKTGLEKPPGSYRHTGAGNRLKELPLSLEAAEQISRRYSTDIDLLGYRQEIDQWLSWKAKQESEENEIDKAEPMH